MMERQCAATKVLDAPLIHLTMVHLGSMTLYACWLRPIALSGVTSVPAAG